MRLAPGTVWKTWCELPEWITWQPETLEASWLDGKRPWENGSCFSLLRELPFGILSRIPTFKARRFIGQVLSSSEEQLLVWELRPTRLSWFGPILVESVRLSPAPGGTTVSLTLTAHGLAPKMMAPVLNQALQSQVEATLEGLEHHLAPIIRGR